MEEYVGYPRAPRPDRMHPIGSYVLQGAGCHHEDEDHNLIFIWGSAPYPDVVLQVVDSATPC
eukprot:3766446-Pleurochrysis_carterae.AAC.1